MAPPIVFIMGSDSDLPTLQGGFELLESLGVSFGARILSAHRTPREATSFAEKAASEGVQVLVAAAGLAAHLAGVLAAHTTLPVVGVPMGGGALGGVDALYSTVQMPGGVPVASMGIGKAGAKNAALFALRILALHDEALRKKLEGFIQDQARVVLEKDRKVRENYGW
ncbi:MAG TPA: 5-(carboxyamino)imidazole ribonucleotide mutase [Planctomycetes bacterium]|nr:5-(carboxyamino)imidazole ribonucleotide mutase [Planctomycetota bacterium]